MKCIILEFDKRKIEIKELLEHVDYYIEKSCEAIELYSKRDISGSREIFKELRNRLKEEYKYYNKVSVRRHIRNRGVYVMYTKEVINAYVKQSNVNCDNRLLANLENIYYYMGYCKRVIGGLE